MEGFRCCDEVPDEGEPGCLLRIVYMCDICIDIYIQIIRAAVAHTHTYIYYTGQVSTQTNAERGAGGARSGEAGAEYRRSHETKAAVLLLQLLWASLHDRQSQRRGTGHPTGRPGDSCTDHPDFDFDSGRVQDDDLPDAPSAPLSNDFGQVRALASALRSTRDCVSRHCRGSRAGVLALQCRYIMSMMILQATKGTVLNIRADGEDEASALQQIVALINDLFEEAE